MYDIEHWTSSRPTRLILLHGPAGIGKTEAALTFVNERLGQFSHTWYFQCDNPLSYTQSYHNFAENLQIPLEEKEPADQLVNKVHRKLQTSTFERPWILVFDNVDQKIPIPERGGLVLLISQQKKVYHDNVESIQLQPFTLEETKDFLLKKLESGQLEGLERLHKETGGWPLLLSQVPPYLQGKKKKITDYLKELEKIDPIFSKEETRYPRSLGQAFELTLQEVENAHPESLKLLYFCAYLNPDSIVLELFSSWQEGNPLYWERKIIDPLVDLAILGRLDTGKTFKLHRVWKKYLKAKLEREGKSNDQFSQNVNLLNQVLSEFDIEQPKTWSKAKVCANSIELADDEWSKFAINKGWKLLNEIGLSLVHSEENASFAKAILEKALEIARRNGEDSSSIAEIYDNISENFSNLDRYDEALEYAQKSLKIRKETVDEESGFIVRSYRRMYESFQGLGRYLEALEYAEKILQNQKKTWNEEQPVVASAYEDVGYTLRDLGQHENALRHFEKGLEIRKKIFQDHIPDWAQYRIIESYSNIGKCLIDLDRKQEALEYVIRAWESLKNISKEPPFISNCLCVYLNDLGQHQAALECLQRTLEIRLNVFGQAHPNTLSSYRAVAYHLTSLDRDQEALEYWDKSLEITERIFGKINERVAISYNSIGNSLLKLGKSQEALTKYKKSLEICREVPDEAGLIILYKSIGICLKNLDRYEEALESFEKALEIWEQGPRMSNSDDIICKIIDCLTHLDRNDDVLKYKERLTVDFLFMGPEEVKARC